jgi:hypothetical protein
VLAEVDVGTSIELLDDDEVSASVLPDVEVGALELLEIDLDVSVVVAAVVVDAAVLLEVVVDASVVDVLSGAALVVSRTVVSAVAFCRYSYVNPLLPPRIMSDVRFTAVPGDAATTSLTMTPSASLTSPRMLPNHECPKSAFCSGRMSTALGEGG